MKLSLVRANNQTYIAFKSGFPLVFGIAFLGSKSFCLFFKIPKKIADKIKIKGFEPLRYEESWKQILYKIDNNNIELKKFDALFEESYKYITGKYLTFPYFLVTTRNSFNIFFCLGSKCT